MRVHVGFPRSAAALVVACTVLGASTGVAGSTTPTGFLGGLTQITYGCPGPQRVGQQCERWSVFAQARFVLRRDQANGTPIPTSRRVVVSDRNGRFTLTLAAGSYSISPLAQQHTKGGRSLTARVRAGQTTRIKVRFLGYPMMA